ncbi:MAG TPA: twin-arginine translocase subunit TatC [Sedimenticola thiotaurini]|uniref:Sec-independent protein translocase protein TatC n=1 Tax=Sedimenticola thiotaurini TaxID=1543721 RepID=A0A831RKU4_9GAMM|nr:twin-arginine translocase subunit TatC [Sedimenticola thiotaurini]
MTTSSDPSDTPLKEQPFVSHLLELRDRLLRAVIAVGIVFVALFPFANDIYVWVAEPLMRALPEGTSMIATGVASPFLTPFKLTLMAAIILAMPYILYQLWAFIAPGLYKHEKKLVVPLVISSTLLFYLGMLFAYFVVFPLVFAFLTGTAPEGVEVATDISNYLDFILTLFFAFGMAFEMPIATIILVWMGVTTPEKLTSKRPYIIVGVFALGMLLTPPDVISQTLLAVPMWILFELGVLFSRFFVRNKEEGETETASGELVVAAAAAGGAGERQPPPSPPPAEEVIGGFDGDPSPGADEPLDPDRFVPLTEEELDAELDLIEAEEEDDDEAGEPQADADPVEQKLRRVQILRDQGNVQGARELLYQVLSEGDGDQVKVARNILQQLDEVEGP